MCIRSFLEPWEHFLLLSLLCLSFNGGARKVRGCWDSVNVNIIGAPKIREKKMCYQIVIFTKIAILDFCLLLLVKLSLLTFFASFLVRNQYKKRRKEIKSDNFCFCKVERAKSKWGAKIKSPILVKKNKSSPKLFRILGVPIIFSLTVG